MRTHIYIIILSKETKHLRKGEKNVILRITKKTLEDNDWGIGTYSKEEAIKAAIKYDYMRIAVIEEGPDPICIEELIIGRDF